MTRHPSRSLRLLAPLLLAVVAAAVPAQSADAFENRERASLQVHLDRSSYLPGAPLRLAAVLTVDRGWHVNANEPTYDYLIPTTLEVGVPEGWGEATVAYPEAVRSTFAFADEPLDVYAGEVVMIATLEVPAGIEPVPDPRTVPLVAEVRYQACDDDSCLPPVTTRGTVEVTVGEGGEPRDEELFRGGPRTGGEEEAHGGAAGDSEGGSGKGNGTGSGDPAAPLGAGDLALKLLLGVIGGLILNVMPCVLPVLSLKVFGLVKSAGQGRGQVVTGALATTAGILASFWALALFAVLARAAGAAVGWGVQFQEPGFVAFLAVVVVLFCLNLWGLFEIPLPGRLANAMGGGPQEGVAGHFASGLFATLMATPCSAPFLGAAVGFALTQPGAVIFAVFTAIGVGMALPYLALAVAPGAARLLPKPGAWMERVKNLMGFLLAAAAVWLFFVLAGQISAERLAAIELGLLVLALFVWMRHRLSAPWVRRAAAVGIAAAAIAPMVLAVGAGEVASDGGEVRKLIPWQEFDRAEAEELAAAGRLVFVDVTADWCFTCKANERLVLETRPTAELFERHGVVPMKADWTNRDDDIAAFLADHGKYSIPFYLLYRPGREPLPFSELLTKEVVRKAVEEAAGR